MRPKAIRYTLVSAASGTLFAAMDALINGNSLAQRLYEIYAPIARTTVNVTAGLFIDLFFGFALAAIFSLLYESLPGISGSAKGVSFAVIVWFLRVVMYVASQWMILNIPSETLLYTLVTGFGEMLVLGAFFGLALRPQGQP